MKDYDERLESIERFIDELKIHMVSNLNAQKANKKKSANIYLAKAKFGENGIAKKRTFKIKLYGFE